MNIETEKNKLTKCYKDVLKISGENIFLGEFDDFYRFYTKDKKQKTIVASYFDYGHENPKFKKIRKPLQKNNEFYEYIRFSKLRNFIQNDKKRTYKFSCLDLKSPVETSMALTHLWNNMAYGGIIFVRDYNNKTIEKIIQNFISSKEKYIISSRPMLISGTRENHICLKIFNPKKYFAYNKKSRNNIPVKIACVLNKSKEFNEKSVNNLISNIKNNITVPHSIHCLTNHQSGLNSKLIDEIIPLKYNLPTWWAKIELFKDNIFNEKDQILYFDLDTVIIDNIDDIASYRGQFAGLRDFYHMFGMASGVMSWNAASGYHIFNNFIQKKDYIIRNYSMGDQQWIRENVDHEYLQDNFPGKIISFKKDMREKNKSLPPKDSSIVCFHGKPKIKECGNSFLLSKWRS